MSWMSRHVIVVKYLLILSNITHRIAVPPAFSANPTLASDEYDFMPLGISARHNEIETKHSAK